VPTQGHFCIELCSCAGAPDALRGVLKLAEAHLSEMVHSAWDFTLANPSYNPKRTSLFTVDSAGATLEGTHKQEKLTHGAMMEQQAYERCAYGSDREPSSSPSDADYTSSDDASDSDDEDGGDRHVTAGSSPDDNDDAEDVSENALHDESGTVQKPFSEYYSLTTDFNFRMQSFTRENL
jgi:hypothetical protein